MNSQEIQSARHIAEIKMTPAQRFKRRIIGIPAVKETYAYYLLARRMQQEVHPALKYVNSQHGLKVLKSMEGYVNPEQVKWLSEFIRFHEDIKNVAQTGFNGGHSAAVMLNERPDVTLISFDIAEHDYVDAAAESIDKLFPGRHRLVKGDSKQTLIKGQFAQPFDMVFVDGGHDYDTAYADLMNFHKLARSGGFVVMDDYLPDQDFGIGPFRAWNDMVKQGFIEQLGEVQKNNRAWVYGRFVDNDIGARERT